MGAEAEWLSDDEQQVWRAYICASNLVGRLLDRDLRVAGDLTSDDYGILAMLSEADGHRLRLGEVARLLYLPKAFLTYRIQRLEKAGWVVREECPSDGRGVLAVLTDAGFAHLTTVAPAHVASVRRNLFDHLDADQRAALGRAMTALLAGHTAAATDEPCPDDEPCLDATPCPEGDLE